MKSLPGFARNVLFFDNFPCDLAARIFASRAVESYRASYARVIPPSEQLRTLRKFAVLVIHEGDGASAKSLKLTVKTHNGVWRRDVRPASPARDE